MIKGLNEKKPVRELLHLTTTKHNHVEITNDRSQVKMLCEIL